ncbi:MAG: hypothetical protein CVU29_03855 [Betaproteobacteria bacterium HGW-Betaproteobacteria-22]|nr:MAG: hypothetical protein CVU29_03855 [Betaproteobacteria bacterium HGW-Betaproteobacteria-22]
MIATTNISLKVPFNEKDQAKALGARWNAESKHWYVPQGVDAALFEKWITNSSSPAPTQAATKPVAQADNIATSQKSLDEDMDVINAKLRDAYEMREIDVL